MKYADLPLSEKNALHRLAHKRNKILYWYSIFVTTFSVFTAQVISRAYRFIYEGHIAHIVIFYILAAGLMYWGYLSIIQPRVMHEIEKIRNENGA
jgi:hypothetical protein